MNTDTGQIMSMEKLKAYMDEKHPQSKKENWVEVPPEMEAKLRRMNRADRRKWYKENKMAWKPFPHPPSEAGRGEGESS